MNKKSSRLTRREFIASLTAAGTVATLAKPPLMKAAEPPLVMGFLYGGPKNDLGYNQAHAEGKQSVALYLSSEPLKKPMFSKPSPQKSRCGT